jgi:hypothetical protein
MTHPKTAAGIVKRIAKLERELDELRKKLHKMTLVAETITGKKEEKEEIHAPWQHGTHIDSLPTQNNLAANPLTGVTRRR